MTHRVFSVTQLVWSGTVWLTWPMIDGGRGTVRKALIWQHGEETMSKLVRISLTLCLYQIFLSSTLTPRTQPRWYYLGLCSPLCQGDYRAVIWTLVQQCWWERSVTLCTHTHKTKKRKEEKRGKKKKRRGGLILLHFAFLQSQGNTGQEAQESPLIQIRCTLWTSQTELAETVDTVQTCRSRKRCTLSIEQLFFSSIWQQCRLCIMAMRS